MTLFDGSVFAPGNVWIAVLTTIFTFFSHLVTGIPEEKLSVHDDMEQYRKSFISAVSYKVICILLHNGQVLIDNLRDRYNQSIMDLNNNG